MKIKSLKKKCVQISKEKEKILLEKMFIENGLLNPPEEYKNKLEGYLIKLGEEERLLKDIILLKEKECACYGRNYKTY